MKRARPAPTVKSPARRPRRLLTVLGARPQFVKAAAFSHALQAAGGWQEIIVHTGQHFDRVLSGIFLNQLEIPAPAYQIIPLPGADRLTRLAHMTRELVRVMGLAKPELVIVTGDTDSTAAGALAARSLGLPLAHIEAGLRIHDAAMPEETNRVLADHLADLLLAPCANAARQLQREKVRGKIVVTGDLMLDTLLRSRPKVPPADRLLRRFGLRPGAYSVLTLHRAEILNHPAHLQRTIHDLDRISRVRHRIMLPAHPHTAQLLAGIPRRERRNLRVISALPYFDMLSLMQTAHSVLTDSGGLQKEAFWLGVPCVTLRSGTEWIETVALGWNTLCDPRQPDFEARLARLLPKLRRPPRISPVYGRGNAGHRTVAAIREFLS